ncbi:Flp pilus assembly protein CpaB [Phenylobacterium sp.]|uniref:Flp pilus assembly protein CpaB n=1 Tax=Phenylobacterium sp. TaxID=1871053 RepID=UPI0035B4A17F
MLTARRLKVLSLALLMSGGTVVLTQQWLQGAVRQAAADARAEATPAAPAAGARVLVAATALPAGTLLKPEQVRWQDWPADASTAGYLTQANATPEQLAGAVVRTSLDAGEPLTATRVAKPGDRSFMAAVLRPGYRAVTVNVTTSAAVAGFVQPGDHVDLILSRSLGDGQPFVSETVLTDVRVLATDQRLAKGEEVVVPQTATLEVTPKNAEVVAVVSELGKLSLSLRSLGDGVATAEPRVVTRTSDREATQSAARPAAAPVAPSRPAPAPRPPAPTVQVFRGSQSTTVGAGQ